MEKQIEYMKKIAIDRIMGLTIYTIEDYREHEKAVEFKFRTRKYGLVSCRVTLVGNDLIALTFIDDKKEKLYDEVVLNDISCYNIRDTINLWA